VSAYVLVRAGEATVVDTGNPGDAGDIAATLDGLGIGWNDVSTVILTHLHGDHVGSLGDVMAAAPDAVGYAGAPDIPGIRSPRTLMPVGDGDTVFGLEIIATPGHTPGSIVVRDPVSGLMVAGDALRGEDGGVIGPNPRFTDDMALANESVKKLAELQFETIVFGHGDPVEGGASDQVAALAATL
jgi:glyoxylase-like metal-dependent hydrolase (beta-lactamase superfamily II)